MNRICLNCGREMDEFELGYGPGYTGCAYCTTMCPRCGQIVFRHDIIYDVDFGDYCYTYCSIEINEEKRQKKLEEHLDFDEEDDNDFDELDNLTEEELDKQNKKQKQKFKKQKQKTKEIEVKLRKANIEFLKATAKANGEPMPENLDGLSDEELNDKVKPLLEKFMENINDKIKRGMA